MSDNLEIRIYNFEKICRTCLSSKDLKSLYEKYSGSTCLAEMLMACTFLKFAEDDGLPVKICINCINEIKQAFSFAKRCETTDTILRKCAKNIKTELTDNSSQTDEPLIKAEEKMKIEITPETILPNMHRTVKEVLKDYKYVDEIKQEEYVKIEDEEFTEVKQNEELIIENESDGTYNLADESYEEDVDEDQDETYSEKSDNNGYNLRRRSTNPYIAEESSNDEDDTLLGIRLEKKGSYRYVRPYTCHTCGKAFKTLRYLKTHKQIHTGEKPNVCSVCSKAFNSRSGLFYHMRKHTGKKPLYICEVCSKTFAYSHTLKFHMNIHTGQKPYTCGDCSKGFTHPSGLKCHMKIHTGDKPNTCEICSKAFIQRYQLKKHMRIHTGDKPYKCEVCSKAFPQSYSLKRHMRIHTEKKQ